SPTSSVRTRRRCNSIGSRRARTSSRSYRRRRSVTPNDLERRRASGLVLVGTDRTAIVEWGRLVAHLRADARKVGAAGALRRARRRVGQNRRQPRRLLRGQVLRRLLVVGLSSRLDAVDAMPEFHDVHVHLQDAALVPEQLDQDREIGLEPLAYGISAWPQEKILRGLLGDRA